MELLVIELVYAFNSFLARNDLIFPENGKQVGLAVRRFDEFSFAEEKRGTGQTSRIMPAHSCRTMHRYLTCPHAPTRAAIAIDANERE